MSATAPASTQSEAIQFSDDLRKEGVKILNTLQTVIRAKHLGDPIPMAAANVVKNDQAHGDFSRFIRKVAGFEAQAQKAVVAELLVDCYELP